MILYTSDLHFGHKNVIKFDNRPFSDVEEMDRVMIELWNGKVQPEDTVYILGDICYRSGKTADWYLRQLRGHKILILGNHDLPILENANALRCLDGVERMMHITDGCRQVSLCHFPIAEWNGFFHDSWHVYGHIHNRKTESYEYMSKLDHALNAGCMINNYMPSTFDELVKNNLKFKNDDLSIE